MAVVYLPDIKIVIIMFCAVYLFYVMIFVSSVSMKYFIIKMKNRVLPLKTEINQWYITVQIQIIQISVLDRSSIITAKETYCYSILTTCTTGQILKETYTFVFTPRRFLKV